MQPRFTYSGGAHGIYEAMRGLERYLATCGLEPGLIHLVKLRASQLNGCAYCLDMHWKDLRGIGDTEQRLYSRGACVDGSRHPHRRGPGARPRVRGGPGALQ